MTTIQLLFDHSTTPRAIDSTGAIDGQALVYNAASGTWKPSSGAGGAPSGSAGGDLSGTFPNPTVAKLGGVAAASYALLNSPALTGAPSAPTQAPGDSSTKLATTAYADAAIAAAIAAIGAVPGGGSVGALSPFALTQPTIPAGAKWVDGGAAGSDGNPGTQASPWKTLAHAIANVASGDTIVIMAGTYGQVYVSGADTTTFWSIDATSGSHVTIIGDPSGARPVLLGRQRMWGHYCDFWNLTFQGPTGPVSGGNEDVLVWMDGVGITLNNCEVTADKWHAGCFVGNTSGVQSKIRGCWIHDNGDRTVSGQANIDHGYYWNSGIGTIEGCLIEHNYCHGGQGYPNAAGIIVRYCTIVNNGNSTGGSHGAGVMIANDGSSPASHDCTVDHCIIASNIENSVRTSGTVGTGNAVTNNYVWNNGSGNIGAEATGLTLTANVQADPKFIDATNGNYDLQSSSPCKGVAGAYQNGQAG